MVTLCQIAYHIQIFLSVWLNLNGTIIFFFLSKVSEWRSIEQDCLECMTFYGRRQTSSLPSYRHDIIFQMNAVTMMLQSSVWVEKYECQEQKSTRKNVQHHWRHMVFFCMPSTSFVGFILFVSESGENFACGWNFGVEGAGTDPHRRLDFPVSDVAFEHTEGHTNILW